MSNIFQTKDNHFSICHIDDKFRERHGILLKIISINPSSPSLSIKKSEDIRLYLSSLVPRPLVAFYFPDFVINGARDLLIIRRATRKSEKEGKVREKKG